MDRSSQGRFTDRSSARKASKLSASRMGVLFTSISIRPSICLLSTNGPLYGGNNGFCVKSIFFQELRSEEHTSELQSRENLVCRLLLEKKKKENIIVITCIKQNSLVI